MPGKVHEQLISFAEQDGWRRGNWKAELRKQLRQEPWDNDLEAISEMLPDIHCIPDAWRMRTEAMGKGSRYSVLVVELLEVEVGHHVNAEKMLNYIKAWWIFDAADWTYLRVFRMDKIGVISPLVTEENIYALMQIYET